MAISYTPDGNKAYESNQYSYAVSVIDVFTGLVIKTKPVVEMPLGLTVSQMVEMYIFQLIDK
jgi:YVTN family beta-propeller protein